MKLHYTVDGEQLTLAGEASSDLKKVLLKLGLPNEIIRRVSIAMYEAEINMVIHANGGHIDVDITSEKIYVKLEDKGPGIVDIELAMTAGYSTASDIAREMGFGAGMGLPNIKRYSDDMVLHSEVNKGTRLEMLFYL